jgi:hypothetical protein
MAIWGLWKNERHAVTMNTVRWSELSAEHEVRYTRKGRSFVTSMSKTSGVAKVFYGLVVGVSDSKMR